MTGKVIEVTKPRQGGDYELSVSFIDPNYFTNEIGKRITIQEASRVLAEGTITKVW
jgi:hypothetical protein